MYVCIYYVFDSYECDDNMIGEDINSYRLRIYVFLIREVDIEWVSIDVVMGSRI